MEKMPWYKSNTLRGLVVAAVTLIAQKLGIAETVGDADAAKLVDLALGFVEACALAYAAYARAARERGRRRENRVVSKWRNEMRSMSRISCVLAVAAIALSSVATTGCASTREAYSVADTLDERAYVATEHFAAVVKQAADLRERGVLSGSALADVRALEQKAKPAVLRLGSLAKNWQAAQTAESEVALQRALDDVVIAIADLVRAVKAAVGGGT